MKLLLNVSCVNQWASDEPSSFFVELSEEKIQRIKELAETVKTAKAYQISEFDYNGDWYKSDFCEGDSIDEALDGIKSSKCSVEIPMLCVTKDYIEYTAVPKHGGSDFALATSKVDIDDLVFGQSLMI